MAIIHQLYGRIDHQSSAKIRTCFLTRFVVSYRRHTESPADSFAPPFRPPVAGWAIRAGQE